ncbi:MAG TPA: hypothetical protein VF520_05625 [Thermoleophilaceae bacterium]
MRHRRRLAWAAAAAAAALGSSAALPAQALAHGIQGKRDLPIPDWLFGWGAVLVLLVSFVALAVLWPKPQLEGAGWRPLGGFGRLLASRPVEIACGAVGAFLLGLTVYSGLAGEEIVSENFAPTFVYVVFWVGLVPASVLLGDVFRALNPWRAIARAVAGLTSRAGGREVAESFEYPPWLGRWPAAAGIVAFAFMELVVETGSDPRSLAIAALVYSAVTWFCMSLYGIERWCDRGEAFSVYFGLFARLAPFERRGDAVGVRRPLSGLTHVEPLPGTVPLLAAMIGSTTFDGFSAGRAWQDLVPSLVDVFDALGFGDRAAVQLSKGVGLLAVIAIVLAFYRLGIAGVRSVGGDLAASRLAGSFVHSLVPIAVAYVLAHYVSLLLYQAQALPSLLSDPLGRGSDLFGWSDWGIDYTWIGNETLWYLQFAFVICGHVAALMLAHDRALSLYDRAAVAVRSQYWMLGVMVGFTSLALWVLSEAAQG